ncbi:hypothetical protein [Pseudoclavibacter sp. AY1H1]|uniref:hypothetical protein n=1 Tax=Pseudoclavibacter sp. AY1H1 TaxID=2080584 RepID=UPI000CE8F653|nr:hypothetical protein [Pseudoclavibacter sp. AY1H1]PPF32648.1 hypothetical protein C5E05_19275 [Pseudoclavibacter sp. AY1H1]
MTEAPTDEWTVEYEGNRFERFFTRLPSYEQAVLDQAIESVLTLHGPDICESEWGKNLGKGLYEFRVKKSLAALCSDAGVKPPPGHPEGRTVLLRAFCTFHGKKIVLLLGGYDKKKDPSEKRQNAEIKRARKALTAWKVAEAKAAARAKKGLG